MIYVIAAYDLCMEIHDLPAVACDLSRERHDLWASLQSLGGPS